MKKKQKKETTLSVLQEIRDLLKTKEIVPEPSLQAESWATITDDGKKKTSELLKECKNLFSVWSYYSDEELDKLCPPPKKEITTVYKESIEPDLLNTSYNDGIEKGIDFMSARERIILELQYFKKTGKGLDIVGWTVTSTLDAGGFAMSMHRNGNGQFSVSYVFRDNRNASYGLRQQIS